MSIKFLVFLGGGILGFGGGECRFYFYGRADFFDKAQILDFSMSLVRLWGALVRDCGGPIGEKFKGSLLKGSFDKRASIDLPIPLK